MKFWCLQISQKSNRIFDRFVPNEARARTEICQKFGWLFGRFEDTTISLRLTDLYVVIMKTWFLFSFKDSWMLGPRVSLFGRLMNIGQRIFHFPLLLGLTVSAPNTTAQFYFSKVHIFWESHKILRNLHRRFDWHYIGQIYGGGFANFCGLLRIYKLKIVYFSKTLCYNQIKFRVILTSSQIQFHLGGLETWW